MTELKEQKIREARTFESFRLDMLRASEKRAWRTAYCSLFAAAASVVAAASLFPLKSTVPYVIELDRTSGESVILPIANTKEIPASDAQDKYWLAQYVSARETYDYRTLENDYVKTRELSEPEVFAPYAAQFGDSDSSLEKKLGDTKRMIVTLNSVIPNGNGIATVRFTKSTYAAGAAAPESERRFTASVGYAYHPEFRASESERLVNPFGFRVTSYRTDAELGRGEAE